MPSVFTLKHLSGSLAGQSQRVALNEGQTLRIGRAPENDIKYNEELDDIVSSVHAELILESGRLYVEDKKSANGTYVNNAPCPPFEKIAVPDGSRLRLGKSGPEIQITQDAAAPAHTAPPAPPGTRSSLPAKQSVGRETLLREIDRAKEEERNLIASEVAKSRKSTGLWLALGGIALSAFVVAAAAGAYLLSSERADEEGQALREQMNRNVWADVEQRVSPAVAHVRCRYYIEFPRMLAEDTSLPIQGESIEVTGSAVLIRPGILLTAKHVVEPWKYAIDWSQTEFGNWEEFAQVTKVKAVYESLQVQFPNRQSIIGKTMATAETSDLALISIPEVNIEPLTVVTSNSAVQITDEVAIIGYPLNLGEQTIISLDYSGTSGSTVTELTQMEPIFLKGTVTRAVPEAGGASHQFYLDASVEPGNSGGPVLSSRSEVLGIVSQKLELHKMIEFQGATYPTRREVRSSARVVSPGDMEVFLSRTGVF